MSNRVSNWLYYIAATGIYSGFILSVISYFRVCAKECGGTHNYKLCGLSFECYGLIFFPILGAIHYASRNSRYAGFAAALLTAAALGAEIDFILVQKYEIKSYCPICLSIAASVGITAGAYAIQYILELKQFFSENQKDKIMKSLRKSFLTLLFFISGFLFAFVGVTKDNPLVAAEKTVIDSIAIGKLDSPVEVYFFSDWQCPACRALEPQLEKIIPKITSKARIIFVDTVVHKETLNFIPYNLSFLIHNKSNYKQLRNVLTEISVNTKEPTEEQIEKAIAPLGIKYQQLNYADIAGGIKYFNQLEKQFDIEATPTMVIVRQSEKNPKKLMGSEITEENVMRAIDALSKN
jgi:protein-disulfide isomerase